MKVASALCRRFLGGDPSVWEPPQCGDPKNRGVKAAPTFYSRRIVAPDVAIQRAAQDRRRRACATFGPLQRTHSPLETRRPLRVLSAPGLARLTVATRACPESGRRVTTRRRWRRRRRMATSGATTRRQVVATRVTTRRGLDEDAGWRHPALQCDAALSAHHCVRLPCCTPCAGLGKCPEAVIVAGLYLNSSRRSYEALRSVHSPCLDPGRSADSLRHAGRRHHAHVDRSGQRRLVCVRQLEPERQLPAGRGRGRG